MKNHPNLQMNTKILFIVILLLSLTPLNQSWAEVEKIPIEKEYIQTGGDGEAFNSYSALISLINSKSQTEYDACLSTPPPYSCTLFTITGIDPSPSSYLLNGELNSVILPRNSLATTNYGPPTFRTDSVYREDVGGLGAYIHVKCPTGWISQGETIGDGEQHYDCIRFVDYYLQTTPLQEEQCQQDGDMEGNPCNPLTGNKFQIEQDYSSSSSYGLTLSRQYNSILAPPDGGGFGKWRHNYDKRIKTNYIYENIKTTTPAETAEQACSSGWDSIKSGYANGSVSYAKARMLGSLCEIYSDRGIITQFEIFKKEKKHPVPTTNPAQVYTTAVTQSNGNTVLFQTNNGEYSSLNKKLSLKNMLNGFELTNNTGSKEIYDLEGKLIIIESPGGSIQTLEYGITIANGGDDNPSTLDKVSNHLGQSLYFSYNDQNLVSTITTPDGNIEYSYSSGLLSSVTYPDGKTRQYHYENTYHPSHLTGITDENNNRYATWEYKLTGEGKVEISRYADDKNKVHFIYQNGKTIVNEYIDSVRRAQRVYGFDFVNGVLKTTNITGDLCTTCGNGEKKSREYDDNGFLNAFIDWEGNRTEYINNAYGYPTTVNQAIGTPHQRNTTFEYHPVWYSLPTLITEPDRKTQLDYDDDGRLEKRTITDLKTLTKTGVENKRTNTFTYDANGLLDKVDGPLTDILDITDYDFNANGNLEKVTNALGHSINILEHDPSGRPKQIQDANGQLTTVDYYPRGWIKSINHAGAVTQFEYDGMGQLEKTTLPNSATLSHKYDTAHRLVKTTDADGNYIGYEYDLMGNLRFRKINDASSQLRNSLEQTYYDSGWLREIIGASNEQTTKLVRDAMGNVKNHENPRKNSSTQVFDALNRLEQITDAKDGITKYSYDTQGNLKTVEAPNGAITTYEYNGFGERIKRTSPDTGVTDYTYNQAGQVITETDARGVTITNAYDALNRITSMTANNGQQMAYFYDEAINEIGRLSRITDNSGETQFEYDIRGNRTAETRIQDGITTTIAYTYNAANQLETITYPSGHVVTYARNTLGQVNDVTVEKDGVAQTLLTNATYLPFGPLETFSWGNGQQHVSTYDADYRLDLQTTTGLSDRDYDYDDADNIKLITANAQQRDFGYDQLERLEREQTIAGPVINYQYDGNGNRELSDEAGSVLDDYSYEPASNRMQSISGQQNETPILDNVGNLTQDSRFTYVYDAFGRLTNINDANQSIEYAYNARHQRVRKTVNGKNTYFQYDDSGRLLVEQDAQGNPTREYIYLGMRPIGLLSGTTINQPVDTFTLSGADITGLSSDIATINVTLGGNPTLSFTTTGGFTEEVSGSDLIVDNDGNLTRVTATYTVGYRDVIIGLNLNPLDPASSNGLAQYSERITSKNKFKDIRFKADKDRFVLFNTDGERMTITVKPDTEKLVLRYADGSKETIQPNNRFTYNRNQGKLIFRHTTNDKDYWGRIGKTDKPDRVTITSLFGTQFGKFELTGQSGSGGGGTTTDTELYYLHTDHLATIHAITDIDQTIVWQGEHDAFGQTYATIELIDNPLRFPGQYFDAETGLHYNWHRYYNPATGRYISSDPIGLAGGINTFGYVGQNPLAYYDDDGLARRGSNPHNNGRVGNPHGVPSLGMPRVPPRLSTLQQFRNYMREQREFLNSCRPETSPQYSVLFQTVLPPNAYPGRSRGYHNQIANQHLHETMRSNQQFREIMENLHPGIYNSTQPGSRGAYPRKPPNGMTWHHGQQPGQMQLVPLGQHQRPAGASQTLHPNGRGGMQLWGK